MSIPQLPGVLFENSHFLKDHVKNLCRLDQPRFPGSQPVSFDKTSLDLLLEEDFWVCEKSDGVRVLVLIVKKKREQIQEVFLIDRKEEFRQVHNLTFPTHTNPNDLLDDTILDGELVIDKDPVTGKETLRLYAFDCIVLQGENLFNKSLQSRYGRLGDWVIKPHTQFNLKNHKANALRPFDIVVKQMERAYAIEKVLTEIIPKLKHGHDGLIFTGVMSGYVPGTDPRILKWKPPLSNSIDFKLRLCFPPIPTKPSDPFPEADFTKIPIFQLWQWTGNDSYEFFDTMTVEDEEWLEMKKSGEQLDDRIVEVVWDPELQTWKIERFRDDKLNGNHASVVQKVISSILDGVEDTQLIELQSQMRDAWKAREARPPQPPSQQYQAQPQRPPVHQQSLSYLPPSTVHQPALKTLPTHPSYPGAYNANTFRAPTYSTPAPDDGGLVEPGVKPNNGHVGGSVGGLLGLKR